MTLSNYRVRRATLDDIGALTALWQTMHFSVEDLAKRITEFQIAESTDGKLLGGVAMQMSERQGFLHSEAYTDFALSDDLRPAIWERLQSVAANNGLFRLWTFEQAPFWGRCGLSKADAESLEKLPGAWRGLKGQWLTLKLKEDIEEVISADKEFAMFMEAERQRTQRTFQQARVLKLIATLLALGVLLLAMAGAFYVMRHNPKLLHR